MRKLIFYIIIIFIFISCASQPQTAQRLDVKEPSFEVVSIFILQADIVVTEFEAVIRIENPNDFAMELSSITYELYGNNLFWAGNTVNNIVQIPANSSRETRFTFSMNFINMNRQLLDDVIAMRQVNYRFRGKAQVRPSIPNVPFFPVDFDCRGLSEVRRR
ncbi:MAG: LEA type 2 family protein [Treponema sp.]|nr:LEA type 2 family protein [Treponema sp.]